LNNGGTSGHGIAVRIGQCFGLKALNLAQNNALKKESGDDHALKFENCLRMGQLQGA
jgi:hypothetical protein